MRLEHLAHQPVDRAADRRDLLQHRPAVGAGLECALKPLALAADAADAGEDFLLFLGGMGHDQPRSEEHTSELQSLMRISYAVFCLKKKINHKIKNNEM